MKVLYDKVLLSVDEEGDQILESGLIIKGEDPSKRFKRATVLEVGDGRLLPNGEVIPLLVSEGDRVIIGAYAGTSFEVSGQKLTVVSDTDILLVL